MMKYFIEELTWTSPNIPGRKNNMYISQACVAGVENTKSKIMAQFQELYPNAMYISRIEDRNR